MAYTSAKPVLAEKLQGIFPAQVSSLEEIDSLLGLEKEDDNDDDGFDF